MKQTDLWHDSHQEFVYLEIKCVCEHANPICDYATCGTQSIGITHINPSTYNSSPPHFCPRRGKKRVGGRSRSRSFCKILSWATGYLFLCSVWFLQLRGEIPPQQKKKKIELNVAALKSVMMLPIIKSHREWCKMIKKERKKNKKGLFCTTISRNTTVRAWTRRASGRELELMHNLWPSLWDNNSIQDLCSTQPDYTGFLPVMQLPAQSDLWGWGRMEEGENKQVNIWRSKMSTKKEKKN